MNHKHSWPSERRAGCRPRSTGGPPAGRPPRSRCPWTATPPRAPEAVTHCKTCFLFVFASFLFFLLFCFIVMHFHSCIMSFCFTHRKTCSELPTICDQCHPCCSSEGTLIRFLTSTWNGAAGRVCRKCSSGKSCPSFRHVALYPLVNDLPAHFPKRFLLYKSSSNRAVKPCLSSSRAIMIPM